MMKLKPVQAMSDLYRLCSKGDQQEQYKKLIECAASNFSPQISQVKFQKVKKL